MCNDNNRNAHNGRKCYTAACIKIHFLLIPCTEAVRNRNRKAACQAKCSAYNKAVYRSYASNGSKCLFTYMKTVNQVVEAE